MIFLALQSLKLGPLAEILGINRTTAYHIIRRGNQREGVVALPHGGKITEKVTAETQRTVLDNYRS